MNPLWTRIHQFIWSTYPSDIGSLILIWMISKKRTYIFENLNRVFSLTWPASTQIDWNKRKRLHKKRVQLPQDWFGTPYMAQVLLFWDTNMAAVTSCENIGSIGRSIDERENNRVNPSPFWFVLSTMIMSWENKSVDATSLEQNYSTFHYSTYFFTIPIILSQKLDLHPYKTILFRMFSSNGVKGKAASFFSVNQVCVFRNKRKKK